LNALVLVTDSYGCNGGIAKYIRDFLDCLVKMEKLNKIIVLPRNIGQEKKYISNKVDFIEKAAISKYSYVKELIKVSSYKYDIVICGHINLLMLSLIMSRKNKCPLVLLVYGIDVWKPSNIIISYLLKYVDRVISISKFTREKLLKWATIPIKNISILNNSITISEYGYGEKNKKLIDKYNLKGKKVLLTLARLNELEQYKGIDEVLEIIPLLISKYNNLIYLIAGEGSDRKRIENKVISKGLENYVKLIGYIKEDEKSDYFRLADLFVMPGYGEGFGYVYLEAMACGVKVIASKLDGSYEAVLNGTIGYAVDPRKLDEIYNTIIEALDDDEKIIPEGLIYFDKKNYETNLNNIINQYLDVIR